MPVLQLVARFPNISGLPEETVENTLSVGSMTEPITTTDVNEAMVRFRDFYLVMPTGGTQALGVYLGESVARFTNVAQILAYTTADLDGSQPLGSPVGTLNFTLPNAASGDPYPEEVAAVISYHGDLTDVPVTEPNPTPPPAIIRPQQRRRGRLYLGPLQVSAGATGGNASRPSTAFRVNATLAFEQMCEGVAADGDLNVVVWSRADAALYPVVGGWMDDSWDTQRRRGVAPTTRTFFTVT